MTVIVRIIVRWGRCCFSSSAGHLCCSHDISTWFIHGNHNGIRWYHSNFIRMTEISAIIIGAVFDIVVVLTTTIILIDSSVATSQILIGKYDTFTMLSYDRPYNAVMVVVYVWDSLGGRRRRRGR